MIILGSTSDYIEQDIARIIGLDKISYFEDNKLIEVYRNKGYIVDKCYYSIRYGRYINNNYEICYGSNVIIKPYEYKLPKLNGKYKIYNY